MRRARVLLRGMVYSGYAASTLGYAVLLGLICGVAGVDAGPAVPANDLFADSFDDIRITTALRPIL